MFQYLQLRGVLGSYTLFLVSAAVYVGVILDTFDWLILIKMRIHVLSGQISIN